MSDGTLDSLVGQNHSPELRAFAKRCYDAGVASGEARLRDVTTERNRLREAHGAIRDTYLANRTATGRVDWASVADEMHALARAALSPTEGRAAPQGEREENVSIYETHGYRVYDDGKSLLVEPIERPGATEGRE